MPYLQQPESHIILGAAVLDDVLGFIILAVVTGLTAGQPLTVLGAVTTAAIAFRFPEGTLLVGRLVVPPFVR